MRHTHLAPDGCNVRDAALPAPTHVREDRQDRVERAPEVRCHRVFEVLDGRAGDATALPAPARRGFTLFEGKARCIVCHAGFNFTDESYHNLGVGMDRENPDLGRHLVTKREEHKGAFKTPTLRDVARRPPKMHDGSVLSLTEVVRFYNRGGTPNPWLSGEIRRSG
jgi:hypothetical protein